MVIAHVGDRRQEGLALTAWVTVMSLACPRGREAAGVTNVSALSQGVAGWVTCWGSVLRVFWYLMGLGLGTPSETSALDYLDVLKKW